MNERMNVRLSNGRMNERLLVCLCSNVNFQAERGRRGKSARANESLERMEAGKGRRRTVTFQRRRNKCWQSHASLHRIKRRSRISFLEKGNATPIHHAITIYLLGCFRRSRYERCDDFANIFHARYDNLNKKRNNRIERCL